MAKVAGDSLKSAFYSLDCLLLELKSMPLPYLRILWSITMPIIYLLIFKHKKKIVVF